MERFTRKNPTGNTYHIPMHMLTDLQIKQDKMNGGMWGNFVNRLGKFEDLNLDDAMLDKLARAPSSRLKEFVNGL